MNLSELFETLSFGVLSNLAVGGEGSGTIPQKHEAKLVSYVNQTLLQLHTKFNLLEKEIVIDAIDARTTYPLEVKYALTDATVGVDKFIMDSVSDPFLDDVIKILAVYDEAGIELPLNDPTCEDSLFTPNYDQLQIPSPTTGDAYYVLYQAKHPKLVTGNLAQIVNIPEILLDPLQHYVAYKVLSPMNGQEHTQKAVEHLARYESLCQELIDRDTLSTSLIETNTKMRDRGFV